MAGYNHVFVRILIAQARATTGDTSLTGAGGQVVPNLSATPGPSPTDASAQGWLQALVTSLFSKVGAQGESHLVSSSVNGKSFTVEVPRGMTRTDVMIAAQTALDWLQAGYQGPTSEIYGRAF